MPDQDFQYAWHQLVGLFSRLIAVRDTANVDDISLPMFRLKLFSKDIRNIGLDEYIFEKIVRIQITMGILGITIVAAMATPSINVQVPTIGVFPSKFFQCTFDCDFLVHDLSC
jgi:hypothetical protein